MDAMQEHAPMSGPTEDGSTGRMQAPPALRSFVEQIEGAAALDRYGDVFARVARQVTQGSRGVVLRGEWLGHALHPLLTDVPLGCWIASGLLDVVGGRSSRKASQRLVAIGLAAVPLTAAAGLADWETARDAGPRRVGIAHALGNTVVAACYLRSWSSRRKGRHLRGVAWGMAGGGLAWGTGYLGGHLSFARGIGVGERGWSPSAIDLTGQPSGPEELQLPAEPVGAADSPLT
jgi:uncharacterized membrane protein